MLLPWASLSLLFQGFSWQMACRSLANWASEKEKLLAQKENLLVPDDWMALFSSPDCVCYNSTGQQKMFNPILFLKIISFLILPSVHQGLKFSAQHFQTVCKPKKISTISHLKKDTVQDQDEFFKTTFENVQIFHCFVAPFACDIVQFQKISIPPPPPLQTEGIGIFWVGGGSPRP